MEMAQYVRIMLVDTTAPVRLDSTEFPEMTASQRTSVLIILVLKETALESNH